MSHPRSAAIGRPGWPEGFGASRPRCVAGIVVGHIEPRRCPMCGEELSERQEYCSVACRMRSYRRRRATEVTASPNGTTNVETAKVAHADTESEISPNGGVTQAVSVGGSYGCGVISQVAHTGMTRTAYEGFGGSRNG